ncbi:hypothetical protein WN944_011933 [Citrus x changshan-huyou]|uniref:FAD-binding PCMH-type domain-containing protein n=1 Tax=Citrus x changshan-huyou TaxID=2935761 RepID=A0AAP0MZ11_9ROSI
MKSPFSPIFPFVFALLLSYHIRVTSADFHATSAPVADLESLIQCLSMHSDNSSISKVIYTQINSSYSSVLNFSIQNLRFSTPNTPKPQVIVTPLDVSQVQAAIKCSKKHGLQIRVRSGGHDFEGLSYVSHVPFVVIDLLNLSEISVDAAEQTAWVQAGATLGQLYYRIAEKSKNLGFPGGLCPTVGESFPELGLTKEDCIEMSWIESAHDLAGFKKGDPLDLLLDRNSRTNGVAEDAATNGFFKSKSDYVKPPIPENAFEGIYDNFYEEDGETAFMLLVPYGGKMSEISESETPYPHRAGNIYQILYTVTWGEDETSQSHIDWIRRLYSHMTPYVSENPREAYINYRDLDIGTNNRGHTSIKQASIWGSKYFKNNFKRLVHVKTMVDPYDFFKNEQSIPPLTSWRKKNGD